LSCEITYSDNCIKGQQNALGGARADPGADVRFFILGEGKKVSPNDKRQRVLKQKTE
jgi:hypothetical protein